MSEGVRDLSSWRSQLRKGAAELAVMSIVGDRERYGVDISDEIRSRAGLEISEGTIYPLLARLQREGMISGRWVEDPGASHPRKYYRLTPQGQAALVQMVEDWQAFAAAMNLLTEQAIAGTAGEMSPGRRRRVGSK
jgi:PadR family transcriptional regulator, regulatory protein PadR